MIRICGSAGKRGMRNYQRQPPRQPRTVTSQAWKRSTSGFGMPLLYQG